MQKLLKFKLLIMIALLSYSTSWCQSNSSLSSTGEQCVKSDSVLISYNDIRTVNSKLIELKYEKEINDSLRVIINNDDKIIKEYNNNIKSLNANINKAIKQRNIIGLGGLIIITALIFIK